MVSVALGIEVAVDVCTPGIIVEVSLNFVAREVMVGAYGIIVVVAPDDTGGKVVTVGVGEIWEVEHAVTNRMVANGPRNIR
jgi:hypothetical protein